MHVLLVFIVILKSRFNIEWKPFVKISETPINKLASELKVYKTRTMTKRKHDSVLLVQRIVPCKRYRAKNGPKFRQNKSSKKQNNRNI